jgi:hypothetical protein
MVALPGWNRNRRFGARYSAVGVVDVQEVVKPIKGRTGRR